mgnify:CR=1 FL=1
MKIVELIIDENDEFNGVEAISIVENPAIEEDFVALKGEEEIKLAMESTHPSNVSVNLTNFDATSLNRYNKGHKYAPHLDNSVFTCITILSFNDKEMQGGNLVFTDYNIEFKFKNNSAVYFPSWVKHHCTEIKSDATRYSIAQFVSIR